MSRIFRFHGPNGAYDVSEPRGKDMPVEVVHGDLRMQWTVEVLDAVRGRASGLTRGSAVVWGDVFWFELVAGPPARIDFYGDGVLVRTDHEAIP